MSDASWAVGVTLSIVGSIVLNVGTNFMKYGFIIRKQLEARQDPHAPLVNAKPPTPKIWYIGVVLMVAGGLLVFGSLGFAPQSLLAPLGSIQFVSNVLMGRFLLKETVTRRTLVGTALLMVGSALAVVFGDHEEQDYNLDDLLALYTPGYVIFLCFLLVLALALHLTFRRYHDFAVKGGPIQPPFHKYVYPLSFCNTNAIIGTQGAIFAKAASHIVSESVSGENQLVYPLSWFFIVGAIVGSIFWLVRMNMALKMFDGLFIIPALQVCWMFWMILAGGTYYQEFRALVAWQIVGFIIAVIIIFVGVYLLVPVDEDEERRRNSFSDPKLDERRLDTLEAAMGGVSGNIRTEVEMSTSMYSLREKTVSMQDLQDKDKDRLDAITRYTNLVFSELPDAVGGMVTNMLHGPPESAAEEKTAEAPNAAPANGESAGSADTAQVGMDLNSSAGKV